MNGILQYKEGRKEASGLMYTRAENIVGT